MKKNTWTALLLAAALLLTLGACARGETPTPGAAQSSAPAKETPAPAAAEETLAPAEEKDEGLKLSFTTVDVHGEEVTSEALFGGNTYTLVNCWTSWCPPCIGELPELETLSKRFAEKGCGVVGLLYDGLDPAGLADALEILEQTGATYPNILPWEGLDEVFQLQAVPTSFFVDAEGRIVGEAIVGAYPERYESTLEELLKETANG